MLRIGICDDELYARDSLRFALEKLLKEPSEEIVYEFTKGETALRWLKKHPGEIDVLFLDVEMPGMNGMETARKIREFNDTICIVFVTGYADYVFDGYQMNALDYLMKPIVADRLRALMVRIRHLLGQQPAVYVLQNTKGIYRFPYTEITYFYSLRRQVFLVSQGQEYPFYGKLDQVEAEMSMDFVRIHQRYLVNAAKVNHMDNTSVSLGETSLPISRALKESATRKLAVSLLKGN